MLRAGRSHSVSSIYISGFIYGAFIVGFVFSTEYGIPIEIRQWDSQRTPLAQMVDITNEFGLKVLLEHNFLNDNNIAFSPYGLMGILVALYEGVDGESSYQIQRSMQLPWNRNIMRIGFRDIHRTLKTYFVPEEGFLAGLALNNENVTFNDSYKKILKFYGFDLETDVTSPMPTSTGSTLTTTASQTNSPNTSLTTTKDLTTEKVTSREDPSNQQSTKASREETTTNPLSETIDTIDIREPHLESTSIASPTSEASSSSGIETTAVNELSNTKSTVEVTNTDISIMAITSSLTTETNILTSPSSTPMPKESADTSTMTSVSTENPTNEDTSTLSTIPDLSSMSMIDSTSTDIMSITQTTTSTTISEIGQSETTSTTLNTASTDTDSPSTMSTSVTLETLERRKKSVVDFLFTSPPYADDYLVYRSFDIGTDLPEENLQEDNKMFLINGLRNIQVSYMHYDSVMEFAYLPHLEASALRLPLDSDRYYLLVVLPTRKGPAEIGRLLARMARESDLSDVYAALHPRRVRAVVPSFIVKGHVTLTTDLQKLGIHDVFEPRQNDFTPMTRQPNVYVRSIEQAVSVAIRKYQPDDVKNRYISNRKPVSFSATYPFLYFVMDSNIHAALMAGKMVDPLNTRIL